MVHINFSRRFKHLPCKNFSFKMVLTKSFGFVSFLLYMVAGSPVEKILGEDPRIHLGDPPAENYPSLVSLGYREGGSVGTLCGATLITNQHILTAAHCYDPTVSTYRVVLGSRHKFQTQGPGSQAIEFSSNAWTLNPGYNEATVDNDNAVITLPRPVQLNNAVQPIRLARNPYAYNVRVVGWGKMDCKGNSPEKYLYAKGWIVDDRTCSWYHGDLKDDKICAQFRNQQGQLSGSDGGDSGGPLYATARDGNDVQIGVVSFSAKKNRNTPQQCTNVEVPMVYSKVAAAESFIKSVAPNAIFV